MYKVISTYTMASESGEEWTLQLVEITTIENDRIIVKVKADDPEKKDKLRDQITAYIDEQTKLKEQKKNGNS